MDTKKLIEVALPLEAINAASVRESFIYRGNPSAIHKWWAQRPLAAARAVIFAQMVDDPSSHPELFPGEAAQEKERQRLFGLIGELVKWENTGNEDVLARAREDIWKSWRSTCAANAHDQRAGELFNPDKLPIFRDPFSGSGALPLEAQRLGLVAHASDLNPVAVLISKAVIEIPPRFASHPPVNPQSRKQARMAHEKWHDTQGLAEDVCYYGDWMQKEAEKRIGQLYPKLEITAALAQNRPDLKALVGQRLTAIAWLWARTVKSPNPAFAQIDVPLASTFLLSTRSGREAYLEPVIEGDEYRFTVKLGQPKHLEAAKNGTKLSRGANFQCLMSGTPISGDYIKSEGKAGRMGARLMAVVADSDRGRVYLPPTADMEEVARSVKPQWKPEVVISGSTQYLGVKPYGMEQFGELFTDRQLLALTTLCDLVAEVRERVRNDAKVAGMADDGKSLASDGFGVEAYSDAVATYIALSVSKVADYNCSLVPWYTKEDRPGHLFSKQAIPMVWDYAELNPLCDIGGAFSASIKIVAGALDGCYARGKAGYAVQQDAVAVQGPALSVVSTDPPYYDNVPYADLSDYFYVWLRRSLGSVFPELFTTLAAPKVQELVAFAYRHNGKAGAEAFFLKGMTEAMHRLAELGHPAFPVTIYYAFKQAESDDHGTASTGWDTFLDSVIRAGFMVNGTWPMRTERSARSRGIGSNALASSIVLVCRRRATTAPIATRREFLAALKMELPSAVSYLQRGNIAPVDLAQASIGPGMAVYTRYSKVLDAEGKSLSVRDALALINQTLDEVLAEQEGDFDADTRWALAWFEQSGFDQGEYGVAETLSKAKNTSVQGMVDAGVVASKVGKVRLLPPSELPADWDPVPDSRIRVWEVVHHLIRRLESGGEGSAAELASVLGSVAEVARELAYRLYTICERKKRPQEALSYNALVQSWPEIIRLARENRAPQAAQVQMFQQE
jgi:putative DNA methylase